MTSHGWIRLIPTAIAVAGCALGTACSTPRVQPWQRGALADYTMRTDRDPLATAMAEHTWFSREASTGGRAVGGSGCGCN
ncbi:MAG TPA: DUF4266 domain-containing protein [Opitutaceae bacterium]